MTLASRPFARGALLVLVLCAVWVSSAFSIGMLDNLSGSLEPCVTSKLSHMKAYANVCDSTDSTNVQAFAALVSQQAMSLYVYISHPETCVVCFLLATIIDLVYPLGIAAWALLVYPVTLMLAVAFAIALSIGAARIVLSGESGQWLVLVGSLVRYAIALIVLGSAAAMSGSWYTTAVTTSSLASSVGSGATFRELYCNFVDPALGLATSTGLTLLEITATFDVSTVQTSAAATPDLEGSLARKAAVAAKVYMERTASGHARCDGVSRSDLQGLYGSVVFAAGLHAVGMLGFAQGVGYMNDASAINPEASDTSGIILLIGGGILVLMYMLFMVTAGVRLIDPVIRILLACAGAPLLAAAWVFAPTRRATEVGLRAVLYAILYLIFSGIVYGLAFVVVTHSHQGAVALSDDEWAELQTFCPALHAAGAAITAVGPGTAATRATALATARDAYALLAKRPCYNRCACWKADKSALGFDQRAQCMLTSGGSLVYPVGSCVGASTVGFDITSYPSIDLAQLALSMVGLMLAQSLISLSGTFAGALSDYQTGENVAQAAEGQMRGFATSAASTAVYGAMAIGGALVKGGAKIGSGPLQKLFVQR